MGPLEGSGVWDERDWDGAGFAASKTRATRYPRLSPPRSAVPYSSVGVESGEDARSVAVPGQEGCHTGDLAYSGVAYSMSLN